MSVLNYFFLRISLSAWYLVDVIGTIKSVCWCLLLIIFANSLDPDQARQNVRPDLDPNCLTLMVILKKKFQKVDFEKNSRQQKKKKKKLTQHAMFQRVEKGDRI